MYFIFLILDSPRHKFDPSAYIPIEIDLAITCPREIAPSINTDYPLGYSPFSFKDETDAKQIYNSAEVSSFMVDLSNPKHVSFWAESLILVVGRSIGLFKINTNSGKVELLKTNEVIEAIGGYILGNNSIIIFETASHDVLLLDNNLVEVSRIKGTPIDASMILAYYSFAASRKLPVLLPQAASLVYFSSLYGLGLLDIYSFTNYEIPNFWICNSNWALGYILTSDENIGMILGVGFLGNQQTLHFLDRRTNAFWSQVYAFKHHIGECKSASWAYSDVVLLGGESSIGAFRVGNNIEFLSKIDVGEAEIKDIHISALSDTGVLITLISANKAFILMYKTTDCVFSIISEFENQCNDDLIVIARYSNKFLFISESFEEHMMVSVQRLRPHLTAKSLSCQEKFSNLLSNQRLEFNVEATFIQPSQSHSLLYIIQDSFLSLIPKCAQNEFSLSEMAASDIAIKELRELEGGLLVYTCKSDNRLCLVTNQLTEVARLKSKFKEDVPDHLKWCAGQNNQDRHIYVWTVGGRRAAIVDLKRMQYSEVKELGGRLNLPHFIVSADDGRKVFAVHANEPDNPIKSHLLTYWHLGLLAPIHFLATDLYPERNLFLLP